MRSNKRAELAGQRRVSQRVAMSWCRLQSVLAQTQNRFESMLSVIMTTIITISIPSMCYPSETPAKHLLYRYPEKQLQLEFAIQARPQTKHLLDIQKNNYNWNLLSQRDPNKTLTGYPEKQIELDDSVATKCFCIFRHCIYLSLNTYKITFTIIVVVAGACANGCRIAGQWLANGWPMFGRLLANGWPTVGQWLANGWPMF